MKRAILSLIIILLFNNSLFSSEEPTTLESDNLTVNFGIGFLYPLNKKTDTGMNILASAVFLSGGFGVGKHLTLIPNILMPGIYGDIHISLISLLLAQGGGSIKIQDDSANNSNSIPFLFQGGLCLYNQFRFGSIDIQPMIGFNAIMGLLKPGILTRYGILIAYDNIGLEYSYQLPLNNAFKNNLPYLHRLVFVYHVR